MRRVSIRCSALMLILALAACSNGRGTLAEPPAAPSQTAPPPPPPEQPPPPPPPSPEPPPPTPPPPPAPVSAAAGSWFGSVKDESGREYGGRALVTGAGVMHFIVSSSASLASTPEFLVYGDVCCAAKIDAELESKRYLNERGDGARFRGEIEGDAFSGDVRIRGEEYEFSLNRSSRYSETLTLQDLAGTYSRTTSGFLGLSSTHTITIDPSGQLHGSHTNGCVYSGTVAIADPPRNLARLDVQLTSCRTAVLGSGPMDGHYTGLGFLVRNTPAPSDDARRTDVFLHSLIGRTWLGQQPVEK